jgi:hypothetical protein
LILETFPLINATDTDTQKLVLYISEVPEKPSITGNKDEYMKGDDIKLTCTKKSGTTIVITEYVWYV